MSQYDFGTINPNEKSGSQLALDLNGFRDAVNSGHKGEERPLYAQAGMQWIREVSTARWDLMLYDGESDTVLRSVNPETNELIKLSTSDVAELDDVLAQTIRKDAAGSTGAAILPAGTPGQRPSAPANGMIRYNSTTGQFEGYRSGAWGPISSAPADAGDLWAYQPIGVPIPVFTHLAGVTEPPKDKGYRYVKLTAADAYNAGILTAESVSGSAPLVQATAVINLVGSPLNGLTVRLMNTEERSLRAGATSGQALADQLQGHTFGVTAASPYPELNKLQVVNGRYAASLTGTTVANIMYFADQPPSNALGQFGSTRITSDPAYGEARVGSETRSKSLTATYYLRIQ
jgi:hypothetical protein